jgi:hypothetical protein
MLAKKTVENQIDPPKTTDEVRAKLAKLEIDEADVAAAVDWARRTA